MATDTITIGTPTATAGASFTVSGVLSSSGTNLSYADDPVLVSIKPTGTPAPTQVSLSWTSAAFSIFPLPSGSVVTSTAFSFTHAPLSSGSHSITVTDGVAEALTKFSVAAAKPVNLASARITLGAVKAVPNPASARINLGI